MDCIEPVRGLILEIIDTYITSVATKYNIEKSKLKQVWTTEQKDYKLLKRAELVELCKTQNKKYSGTKAELISILLNDTPVSKQINKNQPVVIRNLSKLVQSCCIRRNKFNNFEHLDTGLIFDGKSKQVIGKQHVNGSVVQLTNEDINTCRLYKFRHITPFNLDINGNLEGVHIEELDEDDYEEEEDEDDNDEDIVDES